MGKGERGVRSFDRVERVVGPWGFVAVVLFFEKGGGRGFA